MALADDLIKKGVLKNPGLIEAFRAVDRKKFLPRGREAALRGVPDYSDEEAYGDYPLSIGEGQTISQPWTVAFMLEFLNPKLGENILEIGYGSGWQTALLAHTGANVYAIERVPKLCELGRDNVLKSYEVQPRKIRFFCQDGTSGLPEIAEKIGGFDKIIVAAALGAAKIPPNGGTADLLPRAWREQLKIGGKIVAPIGGSIFEFIKKPDGLLEEVEHPGFLFVPLVSGKK